MIGKTILHYEILEKLGQGGMGVVYKARDTKLDRDIAIKLLPPHLLSSDDDRARFNREAKAAAALHHPNIATVFEINDFEGQPFIVMEYIAGETLDKLAEQKPFKLDVAINICIQIAEGLKAAHGKDIVHRDIKSSNILYTEDGTAKILDFGLAKTAMSTKLTRMGSTLGTVGYMSPEQVNGNEVDRRTDLWSLGIVLYEMLTGRLPFNGDYEQAIFYSILNEPPEALTAVRSGVPMSLEWIVNKLLAKSPDERYQSAADLIIDLKAVDLNTSGFSRISQNTAVSKHGVPSQTQPGSKPKRNSNSWLIAAAAATVIIAATLLFLQFGQAEPETLRFNVTAVTQENMKVLRSDLQVLTISPDGKKIVYCMNEGTNSSLFLRTLDSFEPRKIEGTENATHPFFSPDGNWVGFNAGGKIKRVSLKSGTVDIVFDGTAFRGASWGDDGTIFFSPTYGSGIMSIALSGRETKAVTVLDSLNGERTHRWPQILPGSKHLLFTIGDVNSPNSYKNAPLAIYSLEDGKKHILDIKGEMARYVEPGYLIVARNGLLLAAPFDLDSYKLLAPAVPVLKNIEGDDGSGISYFDVSANGSIVYIEGTRNQALQLIWVDMEGRITPLPVEKNRYGTPRISPDGKMLAVNIGSLGASDIWLYDIQTSVLGRFTFNGGKASHIWSRKQAGLYFTALLSDKIAFVYRSIHSGHTDTLISFSSSNAQYPISVSNDEKHLIYNVLGGPSEGDIFDLQLNTKTNPVKISDAKGYQYSGAFSPNSKYIAYGSNESGRLEIYIKTYPDQKKKWQVSDDGGLSPTWSPDGKFLYYISNNGKLMAVPLNYKPFFSPGKAKVLFDVSQMYFPNNPIDNYDVSPDGKRFIMIRNTDSQSHLRSFHMIYNWTRELERSFERMNE